MMWEFDYSKEQSRLIEKIAYSDTTKRLHLKFRPNGFEPLVYEQVPMNIVLEFVKSPSLGKYYLNNIRSHFKKSSIMADKIIKIKIDVTKLKKEWFFKGEKGIYADITLLYNEKQDQYGANGMVTQDVPKAIYQKDKNTRGPILGNCKDWATEARPEEATPGKESGKMVEVMDEEFKDDLPF
jgi:hypothetical protein